MLKRLKQSWRQYKEAPPGKRFQHLYARRQQSRQGYLMKSVFIGGALLLIVLGLVLMPAPGPGTIVLFVGIGLAARESWFITRAIDWAELQFRTLIGKSQGPPER